MSLESFVSYFDNIAESGRIRSMLLTPVAGDPLVNKNIFQKIAYARSHGVSFISFSTNGILLSRGENAQKIIDLGVDHVNVSTPGFDRDYYYRMFRVDKVDQVIDGLEKLAEYKRSKGAANRSDVVVGVHVFGTVDEALALPGWRRLRPYFDEGVLRLPGFAGVEALMDAYRAAGGEAKGNAPRMEAFVDNWSGVITDEMLPSGMRVKRVDHGIDGPPCERLLTDVAVLPSGKVRVCSCRYLRTLEDELVIGDLNAERFADVLFGPKHRTLIKEVAGGKVPEVCGSCTLYSPMVLGAGEARWLRSVAEAHGTEAVGFHPVAACDHEARATVLLELARHARADGDPLAAWRYLNRALGQTDVSVR